jgi:hypothetical protein
MTPMAAKMVPASLPSTPKSGRGRRGRWTVYCLWAMVITVTTVAGMADHRTSRSRTRPSRKRWMGTPAARA